jgi:hypothetical protein
MNALILPGVMKNQVKRLDFYGLDRVKRRIPSQPQQIERAIAMLSNPFFQTPPSEFFYRRIFGLGSTIEV